MKYRFEIMVFGIVSYIMRFIIAMSANGSDEDSWERYLLKASFLNVHIGIRIVMGLLVLSVLVGSRFIGYFAIGEYDLYILLIHISL